MATIAQSDLSPNYAFLDPHGGKSDLNRIASRSALIVACHDPIGRIFVRYAWAGRCATPMLMTKIEQAIERYAVKTFGVEVDGLAGLWADAMRVNAALRLKRLPLMSVNQPKDMEKIWRIRTTLQPVISRGMLFLDMHDPGQIELKNELTGFPRSVRLDMVDALASLIRHVIPPVRSQPEVDLRKDSTLKYLRDTGATSKQIEQYFQQRGGRP